MKYIGPFFRMNSLSKENIYGQLFHLSKEAIKTIALSSRCGITTSFRASKKNHPTKDISTLSNFSPLLCVYKKSSPSFIRNKETLGFDENTFKKTINPHTNALFTLSLLELSDYYSNYTRICENIPNMAKPYYLLTKKQLEFFSNNLRNYEGVFIERKNIGDNSVKECKIIDTDKGFKFSDQAFMMNAYLLYSKYNPSDEVSSDYLKFSKEILNLFIDYKDALYDLSFSENVEIFLCINIYYKYSNDPDAKKLILDLGDYLITKFEEKDYYIDSLDDCALFSICLMDAYKHTGIISFKECYCEIADRLIGMYNSEKNMFIKISDKKEVKYSSTEINLYILSLIKYSDMEHKDLELNQ